MSMPSHSRFFLFLLLVICCCAVVPGVASCRKVISQSPEILLEQAYDAASAGAWKRALELALDAKRLRPDDSSVLIMTALAQENCDRDDDALETIRMASGDDKSFMVQYTFGRMLYQHGLYAQAIAPLEKAHALRPDDLNTLLLLEQSAAHENRNDVIRYCKLLWETFPRQFNNKKEPFVYNELGLFWASRSHIPRAADRAAAMFRNAAEIAPDSPEILRNLAITYDYLKQNKTAALRYYDRYLRVTAGQTGMEADRLEMTRRAEELR